MGPDFVNAGKSSYESRTNHSACAHSDSNIATAETAGR